LFKQQTAPLNCPYTSRVTQGPTQDRTLFQAGYQWPSRFSPSTTPSTTGTGLSYGASYLVTVTDNYQHMWLKGVRGRRSSDW